MKTYQRYWLFQVPGVVITSGALAVGAIWFSLPGWACGVILLVWILKDAVLYPFLKSAYEMHGVTGTQSLVGSAAIAMGPIDPEGFVKVGAELWRARSGLVIKEGEAVTILGSEEMVLIVEPLRRES